MRIVIAGCGRVGSDLALRFAEEGHDVSVIDHRPGAHARLGSTFNGTTHVGLCYDVRVLREAGIEVADAFVAATDSDNANAMAVQVAKRLFGVPRTIARLDDPAREEAYRSLDVEFVPAARLIAQVMRGQILAEAFSHHVTLPSDEVEVVEMTTGRASEGILLSEFEVPGDLRVAAVVRRGTAVIPAPDFCLEEGDVIVAAVRSGIHARISGLLVDEVPGP